MHVIAKHALRAGVLLATVAVLLSIGVLAVTAGQPSANALLRTLQRPASFASANVGPGRVDARLISASDHLALRLVPNRAAVHNRLSLELRTGGRPLNAAHVTAVFSMPAMNMWQALTSQLTPRGNGIYAAEVPVLGMAGAWQLRVDVARPGASPLELTVNDRMGS